MPAHLTLFHNLPGAALADIRAAVIAACRDYQPMTLAVTGLRFLGRGIAYDIDCPALKSLHKILAGRWDLWLTPQDKQGFQPHIVIQNKAGPVEARALHTALGRDFVPFTAAARGLQLWHYRGGPWELADSLPFQHDGKNAIEARA